MTWIPVTERMPDSVCETLAYSTDGLTHVATYTSNGFKIPYGPWPDYLLCVTHWMPLPDPPPRKLTHREALEKAVEAIEMFSTGLCQDQDGVYRAIPFYDILPELKAALA